MEKLETSGERDTLGARHLQYLCECFSHAQLRFEQTTRFDEVLSTFKAELDETRAALDSALARGDAVRGGELLADIGQHWLALGLDREGRTRIEAYLVALPDDQYFLLAHLSLALSNMLFSSGRKRLAWDYAARALRSARASHDDSTLLLALVTASKAALGLNLLDEAETSLAEAEAVRDLPLTSTVQLQRFRAWIAMSRGNDYAGARGILEKLVEQQHSRGDLSGEMLTRAYLAYNTYMSGRIHDAIAYTRETVARVLPTGNVHLLAILWMDLAAFLCAADDLRGATESALEAIGLFVSIEPESSNVAMAIEVLALVCALRSDDARAAILAGFADATVARNGFERDIASLRTHDRLTMLLEESFSQHDLERLRNEGALFSPEAAVAFAQPQP